MATFRRSLVPGATYFFTVNTHTRQKILTHPQVVAALRAAFHSVKARYPFEIDAFVLLPDHLHCIWTLPPEDARYSLRWNAIKRLVSQQTRTLHSQNLGSLQRERRELGLWQRRFWEHQIRDESDFEKHVDYIHWNPVKHRYAVRILEWPYSSFHRYVKRGLRPRDWATGEIEGQFGE